MLGVFRRLVSGMEVNCIEHNGFVEFIMVGVEGVVLSLLKVTDYVLHFMLIYSGLELLYSSFPPT